IEMEGTYTLPEAQIDRLLFRIDVPYPDRDVLARILAATTGTEDDELAQAMSAEDIVALQAHVRSVPIASPLQQAVADLCLATQPGLPGTDRDVARYIRFGVSPRGAQSLVISAKAHACMAGNSHVSVEDLRA